VLDFDFLEDMARKPFISLNCGTFRTYEPFNASNILTADPQNIQAILATKFHDFDFGPERVINFSAMLGDGIFTAPLQRWPHFRAQLKPQFTRDQVSDLEAADRHMQVMFRALPDEDQEGWVQSVDIKPLLYRYTMDVSTEFLFGKSVNSQTTAIHSLESSVTASKKAAEDQKFAEAMDFAQGYIADRMRLFGYFWLMNSKEFQEACKTVKDYADRFVAAALDPNHKPSTEKYVFLDALVAETRNPIELRDQVLQVLLAGRDSTASLLSWTVLLLSRDPAAYQKLREAIISNFGTESSPTQELTISSLRSCKELTHVIYESLRLYPLVPLNSRRAIRDTVLPTGGGPNRNEPIAVREGELVAFTSYVVQRRPDIWGPDSEEFVPSRWEGRKLGWEYTPFSGGPRVCIGRKLTLRYDFEELKS